MTTPDAMCGVTSLLLFLLRSTARDRLVGLVVKASASEAGDPGSTPSLS